MIAKLWISDGKCRVLVFDADGRIIDTNDLWNNRASAESWVYDTYPEIEVKFYDKKDHRRELDAEYRACMG